MKNKSRQVCLPAALALMVCVLTTEAAPRSLISVPAASLTRVDSLEGWTIETAWRLQNRQLEWSKTVHELDGWYGSVGAAYSFLPFVRLGGFAGVATVDVGDQAGDYGMLWGINGSLALLEFVLRESPIYGNQEAIRFIVDLEYLRAKSDLEIEEAEIDDFTVAPHAVYAVNLRGADRWHPYGLLGAAIRAGMVLSALEADVGGHTFEQSRDYGLLVGADLQFNGDVTLNMTGHVFADDDVTLHISVGYNF